MRTDWWWNVWKLRDWVAFIVGATAFVVGVIAFWNAVKLAYFLCTLNPYPD